MSEIKLKTGRLSKRDIEYILTHPDDSDEVISGVLSKSVNTIQQYRVKAPGILEERELGESVVRLRTSFIWTEVCKHLMKDELKYFEQQWASLYDQFSAHEVLATDMMMMKDLIVLEIMCNRTLIKKRECLETITELANMINKEMQLEPEERSPLVPNWETQRAGLQSALLESNKEYTELLKKKDDKMNQLKGTRDQRLKQAEQSNKNFWELMKTLDKRQQRRSDGTRAAKMKLAADLIAKKWNEPMVFADGEVDRPLLTPESVEESANEKCDDSEER